MIAKYSSNNSLQQNINLTISIIIFSFYFFGITLVPLIQAKIALKNKNLSLMHTLASKQKNTSLLNNHIVSYIKAGNVIARSVDNSSFLQSYLSDIKGSITKLITADKNATPGLTYKYDAYGKPILNNEHNEAVVNPFTYNGERYDDHSGLQYLRARFYLPNLKRFATLDTLDLINRTNYASSNPIMASDPSGHLNKWQIAGLAVGGIGLIFGIAAGFSDGPITVALSTTDNTLNGLGMGLDNLNDDALKEKNAFDYVYFGLISGFVMGLAGGKLYNEINAHGDSGLNLSRALAFSKKRLVDEEPAIEKIKQNIAKLEAAIPNKTTNKQGKWLSAFVKYGLRTDAMEVLRYPLFAIPVEVNIKNKNLEDIDWKDFGIKSALNIFSGFVIGGTFNGLVIRASNKFIAIKTFENARAPQLSWFELKSGTTLPAFATALTSGCFVQFGLPFAEKIIEDAIEKLYK